MIAGQAQRQASMIQQVKSGPADLQAAIDLRRKLQLRNHISLDLARAGQLEQVWFEAKLNPTSRWKHPGRIDWNAQGPRVAFARDEATLLMMERLAPELPRIPDPEYRGAPPVPLVKQEWERLASGIIEGREQSFLVFSPVTQIVFKGNTGFWGNVRCVPGPFDDFTALLVDPGNGEAYFVGGVLHFSLH
jgi:hypothetical protein